MAALCCVDVSDWHTRLLTAPFILVVDRAYAPREAARVDTDTAHLRLAVRHTHTAVDEHVYRTLVCACA